MRVRLARPSQRDPGGRAVQLEHLRAAGAQGRPRDGDGRRGTYLGGPHGDELQGALAIRVAVAVAMFLVEALCEVRAERHGQLERLARVAEVGLAFRWELAGVFQRRDV